METFNQKMTQDSAVKSEVSDAELYVCEHAEDESQPTSPGMSAKRMSSEQDLDTDSSSGTSESPLPPRKRAKTQEEKEQRRIERVMRNRQAAHASREKKRKHLEMLETKCIQLEAENRALKKSQNSEIVMRERLEQMEAAVRLAISSGNVSALSSISALIGSEASETVSCNGTVAGSIIGTVKEEELDLPDVTRDASVTSPAPSLEFDCASPDVQLVKQEDDFLFPASPEHVDLGEDLFVDDFSFDQSTSTSMDVFANPESSLKARHTADVAPIIHPYF